MSEVVLIEFASDELAEQALSRAGFSVGAIDCEPQPRGAPRGILHGNYLISKWRHLDQQQRDMMHGLLSIHGPEGAPAAVTITAERVPAAALDKLREMAA